MEFASPALLAGALLAAVPIVLHLMMRRRPRYLEFPALRFVKQRQVANRRTLNLRHLLLLAARVAAIVLLVLALARPTSKLFGLGDEEAPIAAVLVFDTSPRMAYESEGRTRLAAAKEFAGKLVEQLPERSQIGVVSTRSSRRAFDDGRSAAKRRVENLQVAQSHASLSEACRGAVELLKTGSSSHKELYVFTDFSAAAWSQAGGATWADEARKAGVANIQFIDVGASDPKNIALGKVRLSDEIVYERRPVTVSCTASKTGEPATALAYLSLEYPDGSRPPPRSESLKFLAGDGHELSFTLGALDQYGVYQGAIWIDGDDDLADDDVRYFTFEVRPRRRILIAAAAPAARRAVYFSEAIAGRALQVDGVAPYDVAIAPFEQLADEALAAYAAVVLLDPPQIADEIWRKMEGYVRGGGGAVVFLGPSAHPPSFNGPAAQAVCAGPIDTQARYPQGDLCFWPDPDRHPLLAEFGPIRYGVPWEDFPVYRYWRLAPAEGTHLVATYNNDAPAMVERRLGRGKAVTVTTPVSELSDTPEADRWNYLPIGPRPWPFVMLMNGLTTYLTGDQGELNHPTRSTIVLQLDPLKRFTHYLVRRLPELQAAEPAAAVDSLEQSFRATADLDRNQLRIPRLAKAGNYRVQAGAKAEGVDRGFSLNWPDEAASLRRIDDARRNELFGDDGHRTTREFADLSRDPNPDRRGRDLYPPLLCLVAVVLGFEHVLSNRFYRRG